MMNKPINTKMHCFTIDLVENSEMIDQYENYHRKGIIWPEITAGIKAVGILKMDIYRVGNRLMMLVETPVAIDLNNAFKQLESLPRQKEWANLMRQYQLRIASAASGEHWAPMKQVFDLND